jgi:anaerobic selenocysteine-containing dehydrogenase
VVFGLVARAAMAHGPSLARAGFTGSPIQVACALFERICASESGVVFAVDEWAEVMRRARRPFHVALPDLLDELARLADAPVVDPAFPFVLSAGERRSFTANTLIRDPEWRRKDAGGALRVHPDDAAALGVATGGRVRLVTRRGDVTVPVEVSATMQRGHVALPNGLGLGYGERGTTGVAPNELTATEDRDPFVGTPWHKHVPARLERA